MTSCEADPMPDIHFGATLRGSAAINQPEKKLITGLFTPQLERLLLDCGNCGAKDWRIVVSPLKGEHDGAAVIQDITCGQCFTRVNVLDGILGGARANPI